MRGQVRLDGAALDQWSSETLGPHLGFLPQEVELFPGTVPRTSPGSRTGRIRPPCWRRRGRPASTTWSCACRRATTPRIGENGAGLSAGPRQRIGLARALYGDPFLVVLDEPNSNLDAEGEAALTEAIVGVRRRGGICVVIAHRPSALAALDMVLVLSDGRVQCFGPKEEVLKHVLRPATRFPPPPGPGRRDPA